MTDQHGSGLSELSTSACWELLRAGTIGRLAVWVEDHPDVFPVNYVVDHGTVVFRSAAGTKVLAALAEVPVAVETDGYDAASGEAWSVVVKGRAEQIRDTEELARTAELPLHPWEASPKGKFLRVVPTSVTGRRFPVADPGTWRSPLPGTGRPAE